MYRNVIKYTTTVVNEIVNSIKAQFLTLLIFRMTRKLYPYSKKNIMRNIGWIGIAGLIDIEIGLFHMSGYLTGLSIIMDVNYYQNISFLGNIALTIAKYLVVAHIYVFSTAVIEYLLYEELKGVRADKNE